MRTDEQKLMQSPVVVKFGGKDYEIKPLPIIKAAPWRKKLLDLLREMTELSSVTSDSGKFQDALENVLLVKPEQLVDLFFDYADYLDRSLIESVATSAEMLAAIEEVITLESPFLGAAVRITQAIKKSLG